MVLPLAVAWAAAFVSPAAAQAPAPSGAVRVKDVARLDGVQPVPLVGYGLVAGLNKTGDRRQTIFSAQTLANMLEKFGVRVPADEVKIENVAAVLVTAEVPPFARAGARVDVTASSVGDARSLQGGTLLATPLRGPDGEIVAIAQGPLSIGGFGGGRGGSSVQVNHLTVGRVPAGGIIQVPPRTKLPAGDAIALALDQPDFATAKRLAEALNTELGVGAARAVDAATVEVKVPGGSAAQVPELMARIEQVPIDVDAPARVVINERTGTVVMGSAVRVAPAAVAHGNLSVKISTRYAASQPSPFSRTGETLVLPEERVDVKEGNAPLVALGEGSTLDDVVNALNTLGATPRDIIAIVQALKAAGALRAEIVII